MRKNKYNSSGSITNVHEQLKGIYLKSHLHGETEANVKINERRFRIDILDRQENMSIEIQRHNFGKGFYDKIEKLISQMRVIIVHPIVIKQKITRKKDGSVIGTSYINKTNRADFYSLFERLVSFKTKFIPEKIHFDVLLIREHVLKEFAGVWPRSGRSRYRVTQRNLMSIENTLEIRKESDFLDFLPKGIPDVFMNKDIITRLKVNGNERRKHRIAGCLTYSLCNLGIITQVGKKRNAHQFVISK